MGEKPAIKGGLGLGEKPAWTAGGYRSREAARLLPPSPSGRARHAPGATPYAAPRAWRRGLPKPSRAFPSLGHPGASSAVAPQAIHPGLCVLCVWPLCSVCGPLGGYGLCALSTWAAHSTPGTANPNPNPNPNMGGALDAGHGHRGLEQGALEEDAVVLVRVRGGWAAGKGWVAWLGLAWLGGGW